MHRALLLLLLLPCLSWGANVTVVRCWAPDGPYAQSADVATKCPARLTSAATNTVATTSYNVTVSTNKSSGTIYFYTSTSATAPARKVHIAGTGAVDHGSVSVSASGSQSFAVTPVSSDTQYYTHILDITTGGRPSNRVTVRQRTNAGSPSTTLSGYFVGTGGSDLSAGTSHAARFATYTPYLALTPATGTDVHLLAGSSFQNLQVNTNVGGSAGDYAEWACYYLDSGTPTFCTEGAGGGTLDTNNWLDRTLGSQTLPRLYGSLTEACIKPLHLGYSGAPNCVWPSPTSQGGAGPTADCNTTEDYFFWVRHSYVRIRGLWLDKIACMGMEIRRDGSTGATFAESEIVGFRMQDSVISDTGLSHYRARQGIQFAAVVNNIFARSSLCHESYLRGGSVPTITTGSAIQTCSKWAFGMTHLFSVNSYSLYADNLHGGQIGEAMGLGRSTHMLMHGAKVLNTGKAGLYMDVASDSVIEASYAVGNRGYKGTGAYPPAGTSDGGGRPEVGAEFYSTNVNAPYNPPGAFNNTMRNVISIGLDSGFVASEEATTDWPLKYHFIHNTEIGSLTKSFRGAENIAGWLDSASKLQNNLFASPSAAAQPTCDGNWDQSDNLWVKTGAPANCTNGGTDVTAGTSPALALDVGTGASPNTTNITTWRAAYMGSMPDATLAKSSLSKTGIQLNNIECGFADTATEKANWKTILKELPGTYYDNDDDGVISDTEVQRFAYCAFYDYGGNLRDNTPRLGAWEAAP